MSAGTSRAGGRVLELVAPRELRVVDRPVPEPGEGEVRVRLRAVGICGTDVHGYLGRIDSFPMTLGHDAVGTLDAIGPGVDTAIPLGARVTIDPALACGECASCLAGLPQVCTRGGYLGMTDPGVMTDYLTVPAARVVPVPDEVSDAAATVLEPVAVALHLLERIGGFAPPGLPAHVIGGGPLGVLLGQTLQASGWKVTVHEPQEYRSAIAEACGLGVAREAADRDQAAGPVLIVETSAAAAGIEVARGLAAPGSVIALVGRAPAEFTSAEILLKELTVLGVRAGSGQYPAAIALVASGAVTPTETITHRFPLDEAAAAFAAVTDPAERVMRAVLIAS
ncbi:zinc-dependent alcohol dehydrogenase [Herbiconiux liukaitaii]|uniref:zinc-dependent alcohol dehydrogenase n=1 Tax=Herbiconiux liukaitaii TaxID=3342799 RepID=UPI0035B8300D